VGKQLVTKRKYGLRVTPKIVLILVTAIVVILGFGYFGFSYYVASEMTKSDHSKLNRPAQIVSANYQDVTVKKPDGYLKGWLFKGASKKLIIFAAGFNQQRFDTENIVVLISRELIALGYNVLVYDNQATGESTGNRVTFGLKESKDLITVVNFAKTQGFEAKNIGIIGYSEGAIAELLASDRLRDVGAMVADSPSEDLKGTVANILVKERNIPSIFMPGVYFVLKNTYGVDLDKIKPADHIMLVSERVFLYLHGGRDTSIYPVNSEKLLAISNPKSKLVIFPNGKHVETYKSDPRKYRDVVYSFLKDQLGK
jgi:fermentation-respiration switch protein FrsA (DUF1100 family)